MRDYSETFKSLSVFNSWEDKFHFLDLCENKISQFEDSLNEFQFQTAGVFYAEAFAFLVFCEMFKVDIVEGIENAPSAVNKLFTGENNGKLVIKVSDEP